MKNVWLQYKKIFCFLVCVSHGNLYGGGSDLDVSELIKIAEVYTDWIKKAQNTHTWKEFHGSCRAAEEKVLLSQLQEIQEFLEFQRNMNLVDAEHHHSNFIKSRNDQTLTLDRAGAIHARVKQLKKKNEKLQQKTAVFKSAEEAVYESLRMRSLRTVLKEFNRNVRLYGRAGDDLTRAVVSKSVVQAVVQKRPVPRKKPTEVVFNPAIRTVFIQTLPLAKGIVTLTDFSREIVDGFGAFGKTMNELFCQSRK